MTCGTAEDGTVRPLADPHGTARKLAVLAASHGFAAIARNAPLEKSEVVFEAFTWRGAEVLTHSATYPDSKFAHEGGVANPTVR